MIATQNSRSVEAKGAGARAGAVRAASAGVALLLASAAAHSLTLQSRETHLSGQFFIGYATVGDTGELALDDTSLSASFAEVLHDFGAVNELFRTTPVEGDASFTAAQGFEVSESRIAISGETEAFVSTPYNHVSIDAQSSSALTLVFSVDSATAFSMIGSIATGGARSPASVRLRPVSAVSSQNWLFTSNGAFNASGVLAPGTWELYAASSSDTNTLSQTLQSGYQAELILGAVPEPANWLMLSLGLGGLLWRRRAVERTS
jgi:hypothetical protein